MPGVATPTNSVDETTTQSGFSSRYIEAEECEARVNNAVLDAAQVLHLQNYIEGMRKVCK
jgi:hypothetical protein